MVAEENEAAGPQRAKDSRPGHVIVTPRLR
jgi:hypothetical protein